jgi:hypothetical protein
MATLRAGAEVSKGLGWAGPIVTSFLAHRVAEGGHPHLTSLKRPLLLVLAFRIAGGKIVEIDVVGDPERLRKLDLAVIGG